MECATCGLKTKDMLIDGYKKKKIFGWELTLSKTGKAYCRRHRRHHGGRPVRHGRQRRRLRRYLLLR